MLTVINTFQNHRSVVNIKQTEFNSSFSFKNTDESEVRKIIISIGEPPKELKDTPVTPVHKKG